MKRDRKRIDRIKKFWNLIKWEYCRQCHKEFVREYGWKIPGRSIVIPDMIVCKQCCPTKQEADTFFKTLEDTARKFKWKKKR